MIFEVEPLLNDRGQFPDSPSLLTQHALCVSGHKDDLCPLWSDTDLHTRVAIFSQLTSQELVELSFEDSVSNKL